MLEDFDLENFTVRYFIDAIHFDEDGQASELTNPRFI